MKFKWRGLLFYFVLVGVTAAWAVAQESDSTTKAKAEVRNITGCLTKNGGGDEYLLTATDGSTWELHANESVKLADHVGQKVEARGVVAHEKMHNMKEDAKDMGHDAGMKNNTAEHGHLKVTSIHGAGGSCEQ